MHTEVPPRALHSRFISSARKDAHDPTTSLSVSTRTYVQAVVYAGARVHCGARVLANAVFRSIPLSPYFPFMFFAAARAPRAFRKVDLSDGGGASPTAEKAARK